MTDEITRLVLRGEREELIDWLQNQAFLALERCRGADPLSPFFAAQDAIHNAYQHAADMIRRRSSKPV